MEYLGFDYDSEQFNLTDLSLSLNIPTLDECFMTGTDQSLSVSIKPGHRGIMELIWKKADDQLLSILAGWRRIKQLSPFSIQGRTSKFATRG